MKVHVVGRSKISEYHGLIPDYKITDSYKDADVVIFRGGSDITPSFYKEKKSLLCGNTDYARDIFELALFKECVKKGVPMLGICRGMQLLSVANGHKLWQHVTNHGSRTHRIELSNILTVDGESHDSFKCQSDHHQMVKFDNMKDNYQLLGYSDHLSDLYINEHGVNEVNLWPNKEPEIIFFPQTKSLGIQAHPEWEVHGSLARKITLKLIEKHLFCA